MIVELFGLPGIGKTHLVRSCERSDTVVVRMHSKPTIFKWFIYSCMTSPVLVVSTLVLAIKNTSSLNDIWNFVLVRSAKLAYARTLSAKYVLLDEGPLQNLLSLPKSTLTTAEVRRYVSVFNHADLCVCLTLEEYQRQTRIQQRARERGDLREVNQSRDKVMIQNNEIVLEHLRKLPNTEVSSVDLYPEAFFTLLEHKV